METIELAVLGIPTLVGALVTSSTSTVKSPNSNTSNSNKGEGLPDFAIFSEGRPSYFGKKCDDCREIERESSKNRGGPFR